MALTGPPTVLMAVREAVRSLMGVFMREEGGLYVTVVMPIGFNLPLAFTKDGGFLVDDIVMAGLGNEAILMV